MRILISKSPLRHFYEDFTHKISVGDTAVSVLSDDVSSARSITGRLFRECDFQVLWSYLAVGFSSVNTALWRFRDCFQRSSGWRLRKYEATQATHSVDRVFLEGNLSLAVALVSL